MDELTRDFFQRHGQRGGRKSSSQRYRSLIDPSMVSTAAGIAKLHKSRGWDPKAKVKVVTKA